MNNKLCIVIPCYKVENHILDVLKKINFNYVDHIIIVDDFCPNKSGFKAKKKFNNKKKFTYIFLKKNLGVGGATLEGIKLALKKEFNYIVKLDGDDQHDFKTIKDFYKIFKSKKNVNCCKGYRELSLLNLKGMPIIRFFGNIFMTYIFRIISNKYYIKDVTNGLIGFDKKIIKKINLNQIKKNFFFEQDLLFNLIKKRAKIYQIKTKTIYADEKSNLKPLAVILPFSIYYIQQFFKNYFFKR